jgi:hypothetical protein
MAVGVFDPGVPTHVGGRHMSGPTSPDRDSSLEIDKAPGICSRRTPQPRLANVVRARPRRYLAIGFTESRLN